MKENQIQTSDLIYHWTFNDNQSVCDNSRVKAIVNGNPTFKDGIATFNGSTDYYKLKTLINLGNKYSIEVKFRLNNIGSSMFILGSDDAATVYGINISSTNNIVSKTTNNKSVTTPFTRDLIWHTYTICRNGSNIITYIDGILKTSSSDITSLDMLYVNSISGTVGGSFKFNGQLEYIKIWNRQLTASEVKNNYNGETYRPLPYKATTLFHINSDNGVIRDLTGKTIPIATNVQLPKIGSNINVMKFNGSSGNVNLGSQTLVGDITFMGWTKTIQLGEVSEGTIINNGQYFIRHSASGSKLFVFGRTGVSAASSSILSVKLQQNQFICITSTSTGITNFYIGDKNNPPTLSGTDNQNAGTPVAGGTCYLGNRAGDDRTLNGWLNDIRMEQSILTLEEITQYWSNTKYKY